MGADRKGREGKGRERNGKASQGCWATHKKARKFVVAHRMKPW